jgi:hypothetical protein
MDTKGIIYSFNHTLIGTTKLQPTIEESSQPTPTPTQPQTSEQEPKSVVSQQLSQEPQSKAQVLPSETVSKSQIEPRASEQEPKSTVSQEPQSKAQVLPSETVSKSQIEPRASEQEPKSTVSQEPQSKAQVLPSEIVSKSQTEPRTSEQEPKATVSQQLSQEPQSKAQALPSETVSKSQTEPQASEQESKAVVSQQLSQEPQSKAQVLPSETVSKSQTEPRTPEQVPKPAVSQQLSQEPQSKVQVLPSETVSKSQTEPQTSKQEPKPIVSQQPSQEPQSKAQALPSESSSQPNGAATQPTKVSPTSIVATETITPPQKLDSNAIGGDAKPLPERKLEESERGKKVVPEIIEEEKTSGPAHEEPTKSTVTELLTGAPSASVAKAKDLLSAAFPGKQTQKEEKEEAFDRKEAVVIQEQRTGKQMDTAIQPAVISNGEQLPLHEGVRKDIFKFVQNLSTGQSTAANPVSVITLAGENRGASMHLGLEPAKKEGYVHIHRGYKLNPDESTEATTDGEESSEAKKSKDPMAQNPPSSIYINSNIQSVNNSISFDSSVAERNPGVSLVVSDNQEEPIKSNGQPKLLETRRAEFNVTPAEKVTYDPTVRRRCLRGLFMEPSDSDPDNPEKPRRHGCRYNDCAEKDKDKEIGIH